MLACVKSDIGLFAWRILPFYHVRIRTHSPLPTTAAYFFERPQDHREHMTRDLVSVHVLRAFWRHECGARRPICCSLERYSWLRETAWPKYRAHHRYGRYHLDMKQHETCKPDEKGVQAAHVCPENALPRLTLELRKRTNGTLRERFEDLWTFL